MTSILLKIDNLFEGQVIKRPSAFIKTPYVADVNSIENQESILAHTASLGCGGLADKNAFVLLAPSPEPKQKTKPKNQAGLKCTHTIYLAIIKERDQEHIIGIQPKLAETIVENALTKNLLTRLQNVKKYKRETAIYIKDLVDSRFDFTGVDSEGIPFIMEVKNVPLANYEDLTASKIKNMNFDDRDINSKVACFPDGCRKKGDEPISPRALKHIRELTLIKKQTKIRCITCYVIQRTDANRFKPSDIDPEYREAVRDAINNGVEIITLVASWNRNGECHFVRDDLPIADF
jgi:DNA-binding sugar fermentation-stimulating protein